MPAAPAGTPAPKATKAAASTSYVVWSVGIVVVGIVLSPFAWWLGHQAGWTQGSVEGTSAFAFIYVISQATERIVELVVNWLGTSRDSSAEKRKQLAQADLVTAAKDADDGKMRQATSQLNEARADLTVLGAGLSVAIGAVLVSFFNYDFPKAIGVTHGGSNEVANTIATAVSVAVTAIVVSGGSKGLHELISKVQKSKEASEAQAASP